MVDVHASISAELFLILWALQISVELENAYIVIFTFETYSLMCICFIESNRLSI